VLKILPALGAMERDPRVVESGPSEQVSDDTRFALHSFSHGLSTEESCRIQPNDLKNESRATSAFTISTHQSYTHSDGRKE
jgi:hypothetical protein